MLVVPSHSPHAALELFADAPNWEVIKALGISGLVAKGIGFGLRFLGLRARKEAREKALRAEHPDAPWMWKEAWVSGRIPCSSKSTMLTAWGLFLFMNLVSLSLFFGVREELEKENYLALLGLVFPLFGAGCFVWAVRATLRWHKFGSSVFEMEAVPGVLGGKMSGVLRTRTYLEPEDGFHVSLTSIRRTVRDRGDSRTVHEDILWREEITIDKDAERPAGDGSSIPIEFDVPFSCRETDGRDSDNAIIWRLEVTAKVSGVDYKSIFEVPVFKTAESTADTAQASHRGFSAHEDRDYEELCREAGIDVHRTSSGGLEIVYAAARNLSAAFGVTTFTLLWTGGLWLQIHLEAPFIFPLLTGLFEALMVIVSLELWLGRSTVRVDATGVSVRGTLLGIGRTKFASADKIESVDTEISMRSGNTPYYDIVVAYKGEKIPGATRVLDKKLVAGRHIRNKRLAQWLMAQIEDLLTAAAPVS